MAIAFKSLQRASPVSGSSIAQDLLEKFVDHVAGVGVFEEYFLSGNLAKDDADAADTEAANSSRRQDAEPVGDLIRGRSFRLRDLASGRFLDLVLQT